MLELVRVLGLLFLTVWVGGVANDTQGEGASLKNFDVPEGATVFLSAHSSCNPPPKTMKAAFALRCGSIMSTRECMGVSPVTPIFVGRNCQGLKCTMYMTPLRPDCALEASSVHVQLGNHSNSSTCGLPEEDSFLVTPTDFTPGAHSISARECIYGLPSGINLTIWFPCEKGILSHVMELTFEEEPATKFSCKANPTCENASYMSHIICYADALHLVENAAFPCGSGSAFVSIIWIVLVAWICQF